MYLTVLKTAITEALRAEFANAINPDFRTPNKPLISIEYPMLETHYPGIWVQYADTAELSRAGIGHIETVVDEDAEFVADVTRWRFTGTVTLTVVALSSWERDRLYDELVSSYVSSSMDQAYPFRSAIENNDLVAMNANFDDLQPYGDNAAQGTPWGSDEAIYEKSLSFDIVGEFLSRAKTRALVPFSGIEPMKYVEGTPVPDFVDEPGSTTEPTTPGDYDRTDTDGWL